MSSDRQRLGRRGEELARRHIEELGYTILEANYRAASGEIDLVADHAGTLAFVEVRTRRGGAAGSPEESLTPRKRSHMTEAAMEYLQANGAEGQDWRIDLVAVEMAADGRLLRVEVLENAVEL